MIDAKLPLPIFIINNTALIDLVDRLSSETLLAVDTESNSMYAYRSQVCLIQISTREQDYIIDPLAIENMQPLGALMADDGIEKIFHGAEYDILCLKRDFNFEFCNLFDTMQAAQLLRHGVQGLADLLYDYFDIEMDKTHRLSDWGQRPLTIEMVHYAQLDTHYLSGLRDAMLAEIEDAAMLSEAREVFQDVTRIEPSPQTFDPEGYWKIGHPYHLKRREMTILRELYHLRESLAQEDDKPPHKVMSNKALIALSRRRPTNRRELDQIRAITPRYRDYYADDILDAIDRAATLPPGKPPPRPRQDRAMVARYNALHTWRREQANKRDLDASIILPKNTLKRLAEMSPMTMADLAAVDGIGDWRLQHYGKSLLAVLRKFQ